MFAITAAYYVSQITYLIPGITAYETERGSCWFTNNSFTHALKPVWLIYYKDKEKYNVTAEKITER